MSLYRPQVVQLYKTLLFLGRDYPLGYKYFQERCHRAFLKNKDETDPEKIDKLLQHGQYIVKEIQALYMLKKYRTLKRRYYDDAQLTYEEALEKVNKMGS